MRLLFISNARFVRVNAISIQVYPLIAITAMTIIGYVLKCNEGLLRGWYFTLYALMVAVIANRVCVAAGLWNGLSGSCRDGISAAFVVDYQGYDKFCKMDGGRGRFCECVGHSSALRQSA